MSRKYLLCSKNVKMDIDDMISAIRSNFRLRLQGYPIVLLESTRRSKLELNLQGRIQGEGTGGAHPHPLPSSYSVTFKICLPHQSDMPFLRGAPAPKKNPGSSSQIVQNCHDRGIPLLRYSRSHYVKKQLMQQFYSKELVYGVLMLEYLAIP